MDHFEWDRRKAENEKAFIEINEKQAKMLKKYINAEEQIYKQLMEAGDAGAIKDLSIALAIMRRIQREG